jgi:IS30 family transposase
MNDRLREILEALPGKRQRSRLAPFDEFIRELRRRGWTYQEIAQILADKCNVTVASTTVMRFVRARLKARRKSSDQSSAGRIFAVEIDRPPDDEIRRRIAALKERVPAVQSASRMFHYDPDEPLHLPEKAKSEKTGK